ncbi:MAG: 50S ribosomal protein L3 [Candidatus Marinimicrobia bacterium]|nr:50S ribosomal protein L3 [Candidatus Neomarinimicrobiota bacterium]
MKFILGKKIKMTQFFNEEGKVFPATLVLAEPNNVELLKTEDKDGYNAVQVLTGKKKKEFRLEDLGEFKKDDKIDVSVFEEGDKIQVSGISKGKGFQGVVKRHGFHGGPRSHGQKHSEREGGSIGATGPQRVFKGKKMPGRMGGDRITIKNLKVLKVDKDTNEMLISGAIPGKRGTLVELRSL